MSSVTKVFGLAITFTGLSYLGYSIGNPWTSGAAVIAGFLALLTCVMGVFLAAE